MFNVFLYLHQSLVRLICGFYKIYITRIRHAMHSFVGLGLGSLGLSCLKREDGRDLRGVLGVKGVIFGQPRTQPKTQSKIEGRWQPPYFPLFPPILTNHKRYPATSTEALRYYYRIRARETSSIFVLSHTVSIFCFFRIPPS